MNTEQHIFKHKKERTSLDEARQAMYVQRNNEARSRNHCCRKKQVLHILSVCVCSLSHPACKAHAPCYIVICGLPESTIFF